MTPQEKAVELLDKMTTNADSLIFKNKYAKECALVAVDEIIAVAYWNNIKEFWQEVKQEIEKL